jgi:nicotinamide-nucleotide amidase
MNKNTVGILTIGSEILEGRLTDTNSRFFSEVFRGTHLNVKRHVSVEDSKEDILSVLNLMSEKLEFIFVTGGLGPTIDDFTSEVMAEWLGVELRKDEKAYENLQKLLASKKISNNKLQDKQVYFPEGAKVLNNNYGTAPGFYITKNNCHVFCLPGVPIELKGIFKEEITPILDTFFTSRNDPKLSSGLNLNRTLWYCFGKIGESALNELIEEEISEIKNHENIRFSSLVPFPEIIIQLSLSTDHTDEEKKIYEKVVPRISEKLKDYVYRITNEPVSSDRLSFADWTIEELKRKGKKLALAESCTGGWIAKVLTDIPGSSDVIEGGVVSYSNDLKHKFLNVKEETLENFGAVSEEVAKEMAEGLFNKTNADICVSVTGVAGPGGGSDEKPVGTVFIGIHFEGVTRVKKFNFRFNRERNRLLSVYFALLLVKEALSSVNA